MPIEGEKHLFKKRLQTPNRWLTQKKKKATMELMEAQLQKALQGDHLLWNRRTCFTRQECHRDRQDPVIIPY